MTQNKNHNFQYSFWIWTNKLNPILSILTHLIDYDLSDIERDVIKNELAGTNDEQNLWSDYQFTGIKHHLSLRLAYDAEEGSDLIHLRIETHKNLQNTIEAMNLFQSMFKELIE